MAYEVQCKTGDTWTNTWLSVGVDGRIRPETFDSEAAAEAAIRAHLRKRFRKQRIPRYTPDEFRVAYVAAPDHDGGSA